MNLRNRVIGLMGVLAIVLAACAGGNGQVTSERDAEVNNLRHQVESLRVRLATKEQEAARLATDAAAAKALDAKVTALEERLRGMQDILIAKDEQMARLEIQIEDMKKAAAAKEPAKKTKPKASTKSPKNP